MMDDLDKYIGKRKKSSPGFARNFEAGYNDFKIGLLLKKARVESGLTQDDMAKKLQRGALRAFFNACGGKGLNKFLLAAKSREEKKG